MRVVIDTNVIVSALFFGGMPRKVLEAAVKGRVQMVCSPEIIVEYREVTERILKRATSSDAKALSASLLSLLISTAAMIQPVHQGKHCRDADDDKFVNCALSANASFLVSGDSDLLVLGQVGSVRILSARNFLEQLDGVDGV